MDLDELERLHREATPGEWRHGSVEKGAVFVFYAEALGGYERVLFRANGAFDYSADLALACAAVNALPALLQAARRAATMTSADGVISSLKATLESLRRERDAAFDRGRTAGRLDVGKYSSAIDCIEVALGHQGSRPLRETIATVKGLVAERDAARAECERLNEAGFAHVAEIDALRARLAEVERERDAAKQLIASLEERISDVEDRDDDARMVCEWAATVAAGGTDVRAAARRYLMGEKPPRLAALESLAEDARTCAEWCKHMDVGSGAETGAAARRVLAGIGGK